MQQFFYTWISISLSLSRPETSNRILRIRDLKSIHGRTGNSITKLANTIPHPLGAHLWITNFRNSLPPLTSFKQWPTARTPSTVHCLPELSFHVENSRRSTIIFRNDPTGLLFTRDHNVEHNALDVIGDKKEEQGEKRRQRQLTVSADRDSTKNNGPR